MLGELTSHIDMAGIPRSTAAGVLCMLSVSYTLHLCLRAYLVFAAPPCAIFFFLAAKVEPMEVVLRLESSSKWPDELEAVRSTGTAFLIRLAQCLEKKVSKSIGNGWCWIDFLMAMPLR